jgi:hypothetical protein
VNKSATLLDDSRAEREYFKVNGWPVNMDGSLKTLKMLDIGELRAVASMHARTLQTEFSSITIPQRGKS